MTIFHKTSQALCTNLKLCYGMRHLTARSRTPNPIEYLYLILLTVHTFLNDDAADDVDTDVLSQNVTEHELGRIKKALHRNELD